MEEATYVDGFHDKESVNSITYNDLGKTGLRVSSISMGGSVFGNCYGKITEEVGIAIVHEGLRAGINYIDTSPWYGQGKSETLLGQALKNIPRKAYYIGTKVGHYELAVDRMFDFSAERTLASVDTSLALLGLDYVDIIQAHDIEFAEDINQVINETLPALQKIVDQGKARFIGITGYSLDVLLHVLERSPVPIHTVISYARNTLLDKSLTDYLPQFQRAGVGVINASITCMGALSSSGIQAWHPAEPPILEAAARAVQMAKCEGIELADLALQSSLATPGVSTTLLGCSSCAMQRACLRVATTPPTQQQKLLALRIQKECFSALQRRDWGNRAVDAHRQELKQLRATRGGTQAD